MCGRRGSAARRRRAGPVPSRRGRSDEHTVRDLRHAIVLAAGALGYDAFAWVEHAVRRAGAVLRDLEPALIEGTTAGAQAQARQVAVALTRAVAATDADWMGVPDHIATALAHLLTLFMIADE